MITKRLAFLFVLLAVGMSSVFLLPKQLASQPVGIELQLPVSIGAWWGQDLEVSKREIETLGAETEFSRKLYSNGRGDELQVSIVLGGQDMNTSIHRPERCLPAQGWTVLTSSSRAVRVPEFGAVPTTRLYNSRNLAQPGEKADPLYNLNYYWFVGHTTRTGSHLMRSYYDMRDRLLHGYNQRWAYITVAATIGKGRQKFGRDEAETDALIQSFIGELVPRIQKESVDRS